MLVSGFSITGNLASEQSPCNLDRTAQLERNGAKQVGSLGRIKVGQDQRRHREIAIPSTAFVVEHT